MFGYLGTPATPPTPPPTSTGDKIAYWFGGGLVGILVLKALGVFDVR